MNGKGCRVLCPPNKTKKKRKPLCTIITQTVCVIYTFQPAFHRHRWDEGTRGERGGGGLQPPQTTDTNNTFIGSGSFSSARLSSISRLFVCFVVLASASDFSLKHAVVVTLLSRLAASLSIPAPLSVYHTMKISLPPRTPPTPSVCPPPGHSLYYSLSRERLQSFVAYSSCDCSLSALWDACPDPHHHPPHGNYLLN